MRGSITSASRRSVPLAAVLQLRPIDSGAAGAGFGGAPLVGATPAVRAHDAAGSASSTPWQLSAPSGRSDPLHNKFEGTERDGGLWAES